MAQNVKIAGATYENVPAVELPKADNSGNTAKFVDTSDATAAASNIERGYSAYGANGTKINGTADPGGGGSDSNFVVTADLDPDNQSLSNVSATLAEIAAASAAHKNVRFDAVYEVEGAVRAAYSAPLVLCNAITLGSDVYYQVVFSFSFATEDETTVIRIYANTEDPAEEPSFAISIATQPNPIKIRLFHDNNYNITQITDYNIEKALAFSESNFPERLHFSIMEGNGEISLFFVFGDLSNGTVRWEGEDKGIKYTVGLQLFFDPSDIPSGMYYLTQSIDETTVYVGFTLNVSLTDDVAIQVYSTTNAQSGSTTVNNVVLPDDFLGKLKIAQNRTQPYKFKVNLLDAIFLNSGVSLQNQTYGVSDFSFGLAGAGTYINCTFHIQAEAPLTGYYIELSDGSYLCVSVSITNQQ